LVEVEQIVEAVEDKEALVIGKVIEGEEMMELMGFVELAKLMKVVEIIEAERIADSEKLVELLVEDEEIVEALEGKVYGGRGRAGSSRVVGYRGVAEAEEGDKGIDSEEGEGIVEIMETVGGAPEVVESKKMRGLSRKMVELVVFEAVLEAMAPMESAVAKEKAKTQPERII
ncbi:MAG: hypothetical protein L6R41_001470, partial [Letrouitia leprolyta]